MSTPIKSEINRNTTVSCAKGSSAVSTHVSVDVQRVDAAGNADNRPKKKAENNTNYPSSLIQSTINECKSDEFAVVALNLNWSFWPH